MITLKELKGKIIKTCAELGFQRAVIASLDPMPAELVQYEAWLGKGYAAGMQYLERDPDARHSPAVLQGNALSAVIASVSYYTPPPPPPGLFYGQVASYAVGLDYHKVIRQKLIQLKILIETEIGRPLLAKAFSDNVHLNERALAKRHGLGFTGRHTLNIGPKLMGSYNFIAELFLDLPLEPDEPYQGTCGKCFRCGVGCPTQAIVSSTGFDDQLGHSYVEAAGPKINQPRTELNAGRCLSYLTIENKGAIPLELRPYLGAWVFGCDVCQAVCPYNQAPPLTPWVEFQPQSGTGHYIDLLALLTITTEEEFLSCFGNTALRRAKRRGLVRNALVALGNCLRKIKTSSLDQQAIRVNEIEVDQAVSTLKSFIAADPDSLLQEHALWALSQFN